jgi:hypothetical protein
MTRPIGRGNFFRSSASLRTAGRALRARHSELAAKERPPAGLKDSGPYKVNPHFHFELYLRIFGSSPSSILMRV